MAPAEFENFTLGHGWTRGRIAGDECMHKDDEGLFDCNRPLEFHGGALEGACEEHAEELGAIVRKPRATPPTGDPAATPGETGGGK